MESSSMVVGADDAEKWSGSESGWTMYIGSPNIHSKSNSKSTVISDHKEGGVRNNGKKATFECDVGGPGGGGGGDESDDSMASDASSGPSHHEEVTPCGNICVGSGGGDRLRQAAKGGNGYYKCCSGKKVGCGRVKKRDERFMIKEEKEELLLHKQADSAASHV